MRSKFKAAFGALVVLSATVATVPVLSTGQAGAATPATTTAVTLQETAPASVLYGDPATISLTATNTGATPLYNMTIRDILPKGVSYVAGSVTPSNVGSPRVLATAPVAGTTTLIWSNVSDLQPDSPFKLSFKVQSAFTTTAAAAAHLLPGGTFHDTPTAYLNSTPRTLPKFNATTGIPVTGSYTHSGAPVAPSTVRISPIKVTKATPQPEKELERGVHDHPDTYTITVTNNEVKATDGIVVKDWLPAGLEFLGCGNVDHTTTATGTYPGHDVEYPGAVRLTTVTPTAALATCRTATAGTKATVTTITTATAPAATLPPALADGTPAPAGVYTLVVWTIATLAPTATRKIRYYAAVPLRENTTTWVTAGHTTASTGVQTANLNNNTGHETVNDQGLTNLVLAAGHYMGTTEPTLTNPVTATGTDTVVAHDLAVQKSVSTDKFNGNKTINFTLHVETSEYRYSTGVHLTDMVPNGICPIDAVANHDDHATSQCDPQTGKTPVLFSEATTGALTKLATFPYTSVVERADGSFAITWTLSLPTLPAGALPTNTDLVVRFFAVDRTRYQATATTSHPTVTGDAVTNHTTVAGTTHTTCYTTTATPTATPRCTTPAAQPVYAGEGGTKAATNTSKAAQEAPQPTISKEISVPLPTTTPATLDCTTASYELTPSTQPYPVYQRGDLICFRLRVTFPAGLHSKNPVVTDFLPPNTTFVPGSIKAVTGNSVTAVTDTTQAATGLISWTLGTATGAAKYTEPGQVFLYDLAVTASATPTIGNSFDLTTNLMKFRSTNTTGVATSLRTAVTYKLSRPILVSLAKGIAKVTRGATVVETNPTPVQHTQVEDGDAVTYAIDVSNSGLKSAYHTVVWDALPTQITCTDVPAGTISNGGTCAAGVIKWPAGSTITVPAATNATPSVPGVGPQLTYIVNIPAGIGSGITLTNEAGVVSYVAQDNQGTTRTEIPRTNIDGSIPHATWNSPAANATASVTLAAASLAKTAKGTINGPGKATIGELATFTVSATLPAGTTLYTGQLADPLDQHCATALVCLAYKPTSATATLTGAALPGGYSLAVTGNTVTVSLPATLHVPVTHSLTLVLVLQATVKDVTPSVRGTTLTNTAHLSYKRTSTGTPSSTPATAKLKVVEPDIGVKKADAENGGPYSPGAAVHYTVTVTDCATGLPAGCNLANVSTAYDVVVVDKLQTVTETVTAGTVTHTGVISTTGGKTVITWTLASIVAGAKVTLTYTATLANPVVGSSTFKNGVTVTTRSLTTTHPTARTTGTGYQATTTHAIHAAGPTVTKTVTGAASTTATNGHSVTYTLTIHIPADLQLPNLTAIDTLPDGMTFGAYGSSTCTGAHCTPAGGITVGSLGTPSPAVTGKTSLAWYVGSVVAEPNTRTVVVHYTARPSKLYHTTGKVVTPKTFANSVALYWNTTAGAPPATIPSPGAYDHATTTKKATVVLLAPKLALTKTVSTPKPSPGVPFTYTVTVANGTSATVGTAFFPKVTDTLPKGLVFQAGTSVAKIGATTLTLSTSASTDATGVTTLTWTFPSTATGVAVAKGASLVITFTAELGPSATLTDNQALQNAADVPAYYGVAVPTATGDPSRYVTYTKATGHVTVHATFPHLTIAKTAPTGSTATVTQTFKWKLAVKNTASAPADKVSATDTLPAHWSYTAGSTVITLQGGGTVTGTAANPTTTMTPTTHVETLVWSGAQLGSLTGTTTSITIVYSAVPEATTARTVTNAAFARAVDGSTATGNHTGTYKTSTATAPATVKETDLTIHKAVGHALVAGTPADTYTVAVKNLGPDPVTGQVTVADTAPAGTTFTGGTGTGWTCALATAGASISCTHTGSLAATQSEPTLTLAIDVPATYVVNHGTGISNTARVGSPTYDKTPTNNSSTVASTVGVKADLQIAKTHTGTFVAGSTGTYLVTVTNNGPSDSPAPVASATRITVKDTLPAGMTAVSVTATGWTCGTVTGETTVTCTLTTGLAANATSKIHLRVHLASTVAVSTLQNVATITHTTITDPTSGDNTAHDTVTTTTSADLTVDKTHFTTTFVPGEPVHYRVVVKNLGPSDADDPVVTDTLPTYEHSATVTSATGWTCSVTHPTVPAAHTKVTCTATSPLAGLATAAAIELKVTLTSGYTGTTVTNTAHVTSSTPDPHTTNNSSTDTSGAGPATADLKLTKSHSGSFTAGGSGTYTLKVTNLGPSAATGPITVVDTLPTGESYTAVSSGWTCTVTTSTTQKVTCTHTAGLAAGGTLSFTVTVAVAPTVLPSTLINQARVSSPTHDPHTTNNTATDPTQIVTTAKLKLAKTVTTSVPHLFTPGTDGTYVLTVTNLGPSDAAGPIKIIDTLPAGESFVSSSGTGWSCSATGQVVTCTRSAALPATAPANVTMVKVTVAITAGYVGSSLTNQATVTSGTTGPTTTSSTSKTVPGITPLAHLTVSKTHNGTLVAGDTATYTVAVTNTGPSNNVGGFEVTDTLPTGESYVSATGTGWTCTPSVGGFTCGQTAGLAVNDTSTPITLTVAVAPTYTGTTIVNHVQVTSTGTTDPTPGATATDPATVTTSADLSIVKSHTGDLIPGTDANYTLAVANAGPSDAAGPVTVTDTLPTGETYVSATGTGWTCTSTTGTVTCTLAAGLAAGATATPITLTVGVGGAAYPSVTNTATVTSSTPDPTTTNNTSTDPATVKAVADLSITKVHVGTPVAGENLTYQLAVANAGPTPDPGPVTVVDTLPAGETYVSATGTGWTCADTGQKVTCTWSAAYPVGTTSTITVVVAMGGSTVPTVVNTATVSGAGSDPDTANNSATDTATVDPGAVLTLVKTLTTASLTVGGSATYKLTVANAGPSPATNVVVTDTVPAGLQATAATGTGWTCQLAVPRVTCTYGSPLAVGASSAITLTATVTAAAGTAIANGASVASTTVLVTQTGTTASTPPTNVDPAPPVPPAGGGSTPATQPAASRAGGPGTALAFTGMDLLLWLAAGLLLLLGGTGLLVASRRSAARGRETGK